jgi:hypothetical protein
VGTGRRQPEAIQGAVVGRVKMLYVLAGIAVGMLLMLIVGLTIHADDGETSRGGAVVDSWVSPGR